MSAEAPKPVTNEQEVDDSFVRLSEGGFDSVVAAETPVEKVETAAPVVEVPTATPTEVAALSEVREKLAQHATAVPPEDPWRTEQMGKMSSLDDASLREYLTKLPREEFDRVKPLAQEVIAQRRGREGSPQPVHESAPASHSESIRTEESTPVPSVPKAEAQPGPKEPSPIERQEFQGRHLLEKFKMRAGTPEQLERFNTLVAQSSGNTRSALEKVIAQEGNQRAHRRTIGSLIGSGGSLAGVAGIAIFPPAGIAVAAASAAYLGWNLTGQRWLDSRKKKRDNREIEKIYGSKPKPR